MDRIMKSMMVSVSLLSLVAYNSYAGGDQKTAGSELLAPEVLNRIHKR